MSSVGLNLALLEVKCPKIDKRLSGVRAQVSSSVQCGLRFLKFLQSDVLNTQALLGLVEVRSNLHGALKSIDSLCRISLRDVLHRLFILIDGLSRDSCPELPGIDDRIASGLCRIGRSFWFQKDA